jgi:hypothetical protein
MAQEHGELALKFKQQTFRPALDCRNIPGFLHFLCENEMIYVKFMYNSCEICVFQALVRVK